MEKFFKLSEHKTDIQTELFAGITTFFAMSYIIFVNPQILSQAGVPYGAVYLATIIAAVIGTLVMGLFANVPYAQAPGMGLNAFFVYTVVFGLGFTWQQALGMVFLCGIFNILITITKVRKHLIKSIPDSLQNAISGGIGIFIGYIGIKNAGLLQFTSNPGDYIILEGGTVIANSGIVPELVKFNDAGVLLALIGLAITIILMVKNVKGSILLGIVITTLIGIPMGVVNISNLDSGISVGEAFSELGNVFGVAIG
ncbi:MAG: NCS2 family permease, partial [Neofamilia sp.]